jgi:DNA-binding GntR family transcriptional regulator
MKKDIVEYKDLKSLIRNCFRNNIVDDVCKPGSSIEKRNLSGRLNISRIPVREALLLLQAGGLVAILPENEWPLTNIS